MRHGRISIRVGQTHIYGCLSTRSGLDTRDAAPAPGVAPPTPSPERSHGSCARPWSACWRIITMPQLTQAGSGLPNRAHMARAGRRQAGDPLRDDEPPLPTGPLDRLLAVKRCHQASENNVALRDGCGALERCQPDPLRPGAHRAAAPGREGAQPPSARKASGRISTRRHYHSPYPDAAVALLLDPPSLTHKPSQHLLTT